jgi:outer membrane cobalamin receptor
VTAEAAPVAVTRTPNPVRIVEAEELERLQVRTLADLLAAIQPGAVMATGGPGKQASSFLNGTLSRNVVVLLDGVRLNDPTDVSPNLGAIGLVGIERVELLLGPSSVLHGSDAIGGVINLVSAGPGAMGVHGSAELRAGTSSQAAASLGVRVRGDWGWIIGGGEASRQGSDFPQDVFRQAGGFLRMGWNRGGFDLTLHYRNSGQTASLPFDVQYQAVFPWEAFRVYVPDRETRARLETWGATAKFQAGPNLLLENVATVLEGSTGDPAGSGRAQTDRSFRRFEDTLSLHWTPTSTLRVSGRMEGRQDRSEAKNYYDPLTYGTIQYRGEGRDLAGALEVRWELASGLDWVSGLRREGSHRDLTRVATGARTRAGQAEASTLKTGLNWMVNPALRVYASFGQGFRMPNLVEFSLNAQAGVVDGVAYDLSPERSRTLQFGLTGRFLDHFDYRLEAQRTRISNLLAYRYDGSFSGAFTDHFENAGTIQAQSLEGAVGWRGGESVVWGWNLILRSQETRDLDHDTEALRYGQANTAIVRHPFFTASLALFAQQGRWRGDLRYDRIGPRYDVQDVPSYQVISTGLAFTELNAGLVWNLRKDLAFTLRGEHLLNPKQSVQEWLTGARNQDGNAQLVYGYPAPSRRISLAAAYRW